MKNDSFSLCNTVAADEGGNPRRERDAPQNRKTNEMQPPKFVINNLWMNTAVLFYERQQRLWYLILFDLFTSFMCEHCLSLFRKLLAVRGQRQRRVKIQGVKMIDVKLGDPVLGVCFWNLEIGLRCSNTQRWLAGLLRISLSWVGPRGCWLITVCFVKRVGATLGNI